MSFSKKYIEQRYIQESGSGEVLKNLGKASALIGTGLGAGWLLQARKTNDVVNNKIIPKVSEINYQKGQAVGYGKGIFYGTLIASASMVARKIIKDSLKLRTLSKCEDIKDPIKKNMCYNIVNEEIISKLKANLEACSKSKDPSRCRELVNIRIKVEEQKRK